MVIPILLKLCTIIFIIGEKLKLIEKKPFWHLLKLHKI